MASRGKVISLFRRMLRESKKFDGYNYRNYALRRVKDAFKENKNETDATKIQMMVKEGEENLEMIIRQATIGNIYKSSTLVIENKTQS